MRSITRLTLATVALAFAAVALFAQQAPPPLVSSQEIAQGLPADGSRWLTFGGNYANHRYSPLTQITPANVNGLIPKWTFQTGVIGNFETTSLFRSHKATTSTSLLKVRSNVARGT
jgi:quinoprotein glucose dehydrogenase